MNFEPIDLMLKRLESAKQDSDITYFYDLLLFGEMLTKIIALGLTSSINDDKNRTRFRLNHSLVRGDAIGDYSQTITDILTGPPAQILTASIRDYELKELNKRVTSDKWQYDALSNILKCLNNFGIKFNDLSNKAPLRLWFQYFAQLRNKTKGHGAPRTEACSQTCPILEQSILSIYYNFTLFKRPWVYLHQNLSGKYRISYISDETNEFDELKSSTEYNYENGIYCLFDKPRKINLFHSNPELTDFFLVNGSFKNNEYEAISYITDERKQIRSTIYNTPITNLPESQTSGVEELIVEGNTFTNLPKTSNDYITRKTLEDELLNTLNFDDRFPIVTLVGRGGIGKTSLALKVLHELTVTERFDLIIWFSARDIDLLMNGPKRVQTRILNQKDISQDYCSLVYPNKIVDDKTNFFSKQLEENEFGKALYVFDNFETVTNPIEIFEWLNTHIRNPNKVLITSRISRNFKADYPIEVTGMNGEECENLIKSTSVKLGIDKIVDKNYINELIVESNGHPYIIKILLGEVAKSKSLGTVKRIVADQENILTALFQRTFNTLSPSAKRVFLTLCSWNSNIPKIALEAVLWRPKNEKIEIEEALRELHQSSFIEIKDEGKNAILSVPLAASIFGKNELEVSPEKLKILEDRKLLMEFGVMNNTTVGSEVADNILRKFKTVSKRINNLSDLETELPVLKYLASKFPKAWLKISQIYEELGDINKAKESLREFLKNPLPPEEKADNWFKLADICRSTKDWEGESHALSELALTPGVTFKKISDAANRINFYFYHNPDAKKEEYKKILLDRIINVMENRIDEANATDYSRLAWLLLHNDKEEKAMDYVNRGLELDKNNSHCFKLFDRLNS